MVKTPEEYLQDQDFLAEPEEEAEELTSAEKAFFEKYLGMEEEDILEKLGIEAPAEVESVSLETVEPAVEEVREFEPAPEPVLEEAEALLEEEAPAQEEAALAGESREAGVEETGQAAPEAVQETEAALSEDDLLRREQELQLVSFYIEKQEYTVPILSIQEVIRYVEPTKIPESPPYFVGIVNIRGKVTTVISMAVLLGVKERAGSENGNAPDDNFIIICRRGSVQVGLLVRDVSTMYRVRQQDIEWNIESRMGGDIELVPALWKAGENLVGIISVERILDKVLTK